MIMSLKQKKMKIKPRITHTLDLLQVDIESFLASEISYLGRKAAERPTKSLEVNLSCLGERRGY